MRFLRNSIQHIGALAFSCILTFVLPAAASGPRHAQTRTPRENKHSQGDPGHQKAGHHTSTSSKRASIQARPRPESKKRRPSRTAQHPAPAATQPCLHPPVAVSAKGAQVENLALTQCDGRPTREALHAVSAWLGAAPPAPSGSARHGAAQPSSNPGHGGLIARLQAIATAFPEHQLRIHEPCHRDAGRAGHEHGSALDVEVDGAALDQVLELCRTLPDTACGQTTGQPFVHIEVRRPGAGHLYWFDGVQAAK